MKIVFVTQNIGNYISGGRLYPWFLAHCLAKIGHKVDIITNYAPVFDREFLQFEGRSNVTIHVQREYLIRDRKKLNPILTPADLVICAPMLSMDYGVNIAKMYKKKAIGIVFEPFNCLEEAESEGVKGIPKFIPHSKSEQDIPREFAISLLKCDLILCNTEYSVFKTKEWLPTYYGKMEYLYNSFNTDVLKSIKIKSPKERKNEITYISRAVRYKGFADLLDIIVSGNLRDVKVNMICGFLDRNDEWTKTFFKIAKDNNVTNLNVLEKITDKEKFEILSNSKMLVFPSKFEGFGLPPCESFMVKTPVVSYELPTIKEVYKDFPHYASNVGEMCGLVKSLLSDDELLFRGIEKAYNHTNSFVNLDAYCSKLDQIVSSVANIKSQYAFIPKPTPKVVEVKEEPVKKARIGLIYIGNKPDNNELKSEQKFNNFNIYGFKTVNDIDLKLIQEDYLVLVSENVELKSNCMGEFAVQFDTSNLPDLITTNYITDGKKRSIVGFDYNALIIKPDYIPECLGIKRSLLETLLKDGIESNWVTDIAIKCKDLKWHHISGSFTCIVPEVKKDVKNFRLVKDSLPEKFFENFSLKSGDELNVLTADEPDAKVLMIIPARTNKYLPALLESFKKHGYQNLETVVVIHAPKGDLNKDLQQTCIDYKVTSLIFKEDFNFSRMNNYAITEAEKCHGSFDYYVLCNDDIILRENCIRNLIAGFKYQWNDVGVMGAKLVYPETFKIQHAGVQLVSDLMCTHTYRNAKESKLAVSYFRECDAVTFGLVAIDSECYESIKLDEGLPNSFNDIDYCMKAKKKGWRIVYNPLAQAIHLETATRNELKIKYDDAGTKIFRDRYVLQFREAMHSRQMVETTATQI